MTESESRLFRAISEGSRDACARLVEADAALASAYDESGISALRRALYAGQREIAQDLLDAGARLDVFDAAASGDTDILARHLDTSPELLAERAADGFAPLHLAAFFGRREAVELLLARGASVAAVADNGSRVQPLHSAVATRDIRIVRLLLARGADPNAPQQGGWTPLHGAALHGEAEILELLLEAGGDPRAAANDGRDAIALARENGHGAIAERLETHARTRGGGGA